MKSPDQPLSKQALILSVLASSLNVTAVFFIALSMLNLIGGVYEIIGWVALVLSLVALFFLRGLTMLSYFSRAIVGGLFIVSGMVKGNDPIGFSYKLKEYFAETALDWPGLIPYAVELSIIICVAEIVLGFAVILGGKMKLASWSLLGMILFFVWLTYYTANCIDTERNWKSDKMIVACEKGDDLEVAKEKIDKEYDERGKSEAHCVTDCGCFGDAMKGSVGRSLTPWESFAKDIVLLYFVIILLFRQNRIKFNTPKEDLYLVPASLVVVGFLCWVFDSWWFPLTFSVVFLLLALLVKRLNIGSANPQWVIAFLATMASFGFSAYCYSYLPIKDYRPYAVGKDLKAQLITPKDAPRMHKVVYLTYCVDGKMVTLSYETGNPDPDVDKKTLEVFMKEKEKIGDAPLIASRDEISSYGYTPPAEGFSIEAPFYMLDAKARTTADVTKALQQNGYVEEMVRFKNLKGGEDAVVASWELEDENPYSNDTLWQEAGRSMEMLEEPDSSFSINLTMHVLNLPYVLLITVDDQKEMKTNRMDDLMALAKAAAEYGLPVILLSPDVDEARIKLAKSIGENVLPYKCGDDKILKAMVRSNPGFILLKEGVVLNNWSNRGFPSFERIKNNYLD
jgi:hypothetical protein